VRGFVLQRLCRWWEWERKTDNRYDDRESELCPTCGGVGFLSEAEHEGDWVNFSDRCIITCPECRG